jgi:hypothetical protein
LNGWNVNVERCVLGAEEGSTVLYRSRDTFTSSTVPGWISRPEDVAGEEVVRRTTLDAFCESIALSPDLIKVDVEGAEVSVITGGARCFQVNKPTLVVESMQEHSSRDDLWQLLVPLGYKVCNTSRENATLVDSRKDFAKIKDYDFVFTVDRELLNALVNE